jgi:hypothetical protein
MGDPVRTCLMGFPGGVAGVTVCLVLLVLGGGPSGLSAGTEADAVGGGPAIKWPVVAYSHGQLLVELAPDAFSATPGAFMWSLPSESLPPGRHILTVHFISLGGLPSSEAAIPFMVYEEPPLEMWVPSLSPPAPSAVLAIRIDDVPAGGEVLDEGFCDGWLVGGYRSGGPAGRVTQYAYDARGNLIRARVETGVVIAGDRSDAAWMPLGPVAYGSHDGVVMTMVVRCVLLGGLDVWRVVGGRSRAAVPLAGPVVCGMGSLAISRLHRDSSNRDVSSRFRPDPHPAAGPSALSVDPCV